MRLRLSGTDGLFRLVLTMENKKQIITLFLLLCSACLSGQNIQKFFVSRNVEGGMLYFIKPLKLIQSCKNACYFDQTIQPHNDTISIGVTFTNKQAFRVDSIAIMNEDTVVGKSVEHLFTEQVKSKWDCRFFIHLTRKELKKLNTKSPPTLSFFGMDASNIQLQVKPNDWKKIVEINGLIYDQIKLNEQ